MMGASAGWGSAAPRGVVGRLAVVAVAAVVALAGLAPAAAAQDADALDAALGGFSDVTGAVHKPAIDALTETPTPS